MPVRPMKRELPKQSKTSMILWDLPGQHTSLHFSHAPTSLQSPIFHRNRRRDSSEIGLQAKTRGVTCLVSKGHSSERVGQEYPNITNLHWRQGDAPLRPKSSERNLF